jgi:hypothetical protein
LKGDKFVVNYTFTQPGTYLFWPGIVYGGMHMSPQMTPVVVGTPPTATFNPSLDKTMRLANNLVVKLKLAPTLHAGMTHQLGFAITDESGFDVPVGKYLEENMHINVVSQDGTFYSHLHTNYGMIGTDEHAAGHTHSAAPSSLSLIPTAYADEGHTHATTDSSALVDESSIFSEKDLRVALAFPKAGMYKVFGEFTLPNNPNKVYLAEYWVSVGDPMVVERTAPLPKWALALLSLVLIGAVMPLIFKYLNEEKIKV